MKFFKHIILISAFVIAGLYSFSQDTVKVMTYNVLNYGNFTSYCTWNNNDPYVKEAHLRTIFSYASPDIIGLNEISGSSQVYSQRILDSVLNVDFPGRYARGAYFNTTYSSLVNILYYDVSKFSIKSQWSLNDGIRDICFFKLYYNSPDLLTGDTVFITCISMHLKAGSTSTDISDRGAETLALMNHINNNNITGNILVMGDFNVYTNTEAGFQNLVNYSVSSLRFYDPINKMGNWNNNYYYSDYHTQSTSLSGSDCAASGGLDDRFDFILINENIKYNTSKVSYVSNSYTTVGQDGDHYNQSLSSPANYSAPSEVIEALQIASDHLPVTLKLRINQQTAIANTYTLSSKLPSYFGNNIWKLNDLDESEFTNVGIYDVTGRYIMTVRCNNAENTVSLNELNKGLYIINYYSNDINKSYKFVRE